MPQIANGSPIYSVGAGKVYFDRQDNNGNHMYEIATDTLFWDQRKYAYMEIVVALTD